MPSELQQDYQRSFLKWAGGKYRLLKEILTFLPTGKRFIEPFCGSAVVFLNVAPEQYESFLLAENNADLVDLYKNIQQNPEEFIAIAKKYFQVKHNCAESYYQFRDQFNKSKSQSKSMLRAILFLYLNRHAYNGLCRYNRNGLFNVPFGRYKQIMLPEKTIRYFSEKSQQAEIYHIDFRDLFEQVGSGDVIYCDPPYVPLSETASFTAYCTHDFDEMSHKDLKKCAELAQKKGASVIISNHDTPFTRALYKQASMVRSFPVQRMISRDVKNRKKVEELIAVYA